MNRGLPGTGGVAALPARRHPEWLGVPLPAGETVGDLNDLLGGLKLNTVCREARCQNVGECWSERTSTVMILGDI